jgi:transcriptional regulator with XRE-family HTH domain
MARVRRPALESEVERRNREQCARLGGDVRASRKRRRLTQAGLAARVGVVQSTISDLERGHGASLSMDLWQRVFTALDRRFVLEPSRDPVEWPRDAGHLAIQELVLRLGRAAGYTGSFELPTRPTHPTRSADVGLRDDRRRLLVLVECWNTISDVGEAVRSTNRKLAEAHAAAVAFGGYRPHRVAGCWVVRATASNRALVARYPELFARQFPGSSLGWFRALGNGATPPRDLGLVWSDVAGRELRQWRRGVTP